MSKRKGEYPEKENESLPTKEPRCVASSRPTARGLAFSSVGARSRSRTTAAAHAPAQDPQRSWDDPDAKPQPEAQRQWPAEREAESPPTTTALSAGGAATGERLDEFGRAIRDTSTWGERAGGGGGASTARATGGWDAVSPVSASRDENEGGGDVTDDKDEQRREGRATDRSMAYHLQQAERRQQQQMQQTQAQHSVLQMQQMLQMQAQMPRPQQQMQQQLLMMQQQMLQMQAQMPQPQQQTQQQLLMMQQQMLQMQAQMHVHAQAQPQVQVQAHARTQARAHAQRHAPPGVGSGMHWNENCTDCGKRNPKWGLPPRSEGSASAQVAGVPEGSSTKTLWCADCAKNHPGAVKARSAKERTSCAFFHLRPNLICALHTAV